MLQVATHIAGLTCLCPIKARVGGKLCYSWLEGLHHVHLPDLESCLYRRLPRYGGGWLTRCECEKVRIMSD
jgi:hypothetical protein